MTKGLGRFVIAQSKAPSIVESNEFQNLIALVDFYVVSSFPVSVQVGTKCMNVTKYPGKPGRKVLRYSGTESRRKKSRNTGLFSGQIVKDLPGSPPLFPHVFPAPSAVSLGLAGVGTVGLPPLREKVPPADGAQPSIRGRAVLADGGHQH